MFQLDDQFLADVGLADLPEEQKKPFLQHTYDQLEYKVGIRLSEGMTNDQLDEFESIIDRKDDVIQAWLGTHTPNYQNEEVFQHLMQASNLPANDPGLRAEYAATKWLEVNRPDYRDVVAQTLEEIKQEIISSKDAILGASTPAQTE
ncbi:MAG: hypothetical protein EOT05_02185 [Candidatus Microsaccharimonas sossegonensis]|uniref:Uncharacterized protein n=1 Tax=Candidatus Microsaccharimonas sossegonensis TaxID=2506948 RepID=A0A4V1J7F8_9BACT|nr:MAG: hypothetical protein EOT05_02185 [Candidatus Microsaccharimonas sossegonensis]